jgi:arabinofuranosyltransferase
MTRAPLPAAPFLSKVNTAGLALVAAVVLLSLGSLAHYSYGYSFPGSCHAMGADDAYISFRYARNLFGGQGLVYNSGERVEGYTNLLYVLLMLPAFFYDASFVYEYSSLLNVFFAALALVAFYWHTTRQLNWFLAGLAVLLLSLHPALWLWATSGMETVLVLLLQLMAWFLAVRQVEQPNRSVLLALSIVVALCVAVRADGILTPAVVAFYLAIRERRRAALAIVAIALGAFAALTLWRLSYYGMPLPNTYYAKVFGNPLIRMEDGARQLFLIVTQPGYGVFVLVCVAAGVLNLLAAARERRLSAIRFETLFAFALLAYFIYVGGDFLHDRFLLALMPMGIFLALETLRHQESRAKAMCLAGFLLAMQGTLLLFDVRFEYAGAKYDMWVTLGQYLKNQQSGAYLATVAAGKVPYFSGLRTLDMYGLTDPAIARLPGQMTTRLIPGHGKFNANYVYRKSPDLIAAWLVNAEHDLSANILKRDYQPRGYELKYVVNSNSVGRVDNIVDVEAYDVAEIERLRLRGYTFAVLRLAPAIASGSSPIRQQENSEDAAADATRSLNTGSPLAVSPAAVPSPAPGANNLGRHLVGCPQGLYRAVN